MASNECMTAHAAEVQRRRGGGQVGLLGWTGTSNQTVADPTPSSLSNTSLQMYEWMTKSRSLVEPPAAPPIETPLQTLRRQVSEWTLSGGHPR